MGGLYGHGLAMMLVPMYVHPAADPGAWRALAAAADRLYGVVLNVADGPGGSPDPAFASAARDLRAAGVAVLGYADLDYGRRPQREVLDDLDRHRAWYDVDGFLFDQAPDQAAWLRACKRLVKAARARGGRTVVLNPGVHPAPGYASVADLVITFEGDWEAYCRAPAAPAWTSGHPAERFCHLVHGVPPGLCSVAGRTARLRGAAVHCAVTGHGRNPWSVLPPALKEPSP
ncbi:spherulation-specific family 4 protein [Streptomyces sp. NPDC001941]|uniref:spherulation-specific family 4 protein n=1 Tax=Streptomyces sp. NPDC001941 TaxID=3154659 RepID=UPI0033244129